MEELLKILNKFRDTGYTPKMMEHSIRSYNNDFEKPIDFFTIDEIVCALEEEQSCWEG